MLAAVFALVVASCNEGTSASGPSSTEASSTESTLSSELTPYPTGSAATQPPIAAKTIVSVATPSLVAAGSLGFAPTWSPDGSRLYFLDDGDEGIMAIEFSNEPWTPFPALSIPTRGMEIDRPSSNYLSLSPDGSMALVTDEEGWLWLGNLETGVVTNVTDTIPRDGPTPPSPDATPNEIAQWLYGVIQSPIRPARGSIAQG